MQIYDQFVSEGKVKKVFNTDYFLTGDSRDPESAGVASSVMGSVFTILICFLLSFPIAIFASIYLEEFAKQGRTTDLIEININLYLKSMRVEYAAMIYKSYKLKKGYSFISLLFSIPANFK